MKQVFDWVKLQGVDINEKVYGALLKGYIEVGYQEGVSELKTEMRAKGIKI